MLVIFLLLAFRSGSDRYYLKKAVGLSSDGSDVLYYLSFRHSGELILFSLAFYSIRLLIFLLTFSPFFLVLSIGLSLAAGEGLSVTELCLLLILLSALLVFAVVFFLSFSSFLFAARYCFASGRFPRCGGLFSFALACVSRERKRIFRKKLSFLPWLLPCLLLLPISLVRSYYNQSMAELAADLIEKHLQKQ